MAYFVRRFANSLVLLLALVSFVFLSGRLIGDPALNILGINASEQALENFRDNTGLNDPILVQYGGYIVDVVRGDFGVSYRFGFSILPSEDFRDSGTEVLPIALERLPYTFRLAGASIAIAVTFAMVMGVLAARRPGSVLDRAINVVALAGVSVVQFWLGLILITVFAVRFGWFPTSGSGGLDHLVLPALTLAMRPMGRIAQVVRSSMLDELAKPYVIAARAKGVSERRVVLVHALKNAAVPIVTMIGDELSALLTGAVLVETVFAWPGIGLLLFDSLRRGDLPLIQVSIFVVGALVVIVNFLVDLSYGVLHPRVRVAGAAS